MKTSTWYAPGDRVYWFDPLERAVRAGVLESISGLKVEREGEDWTPVGVEVRCLIRTDDGEIGELSIEDLFPWSLPVRPARARLEGSLLDHPVGKALRDLLDRLSFPVEAHLEKDSGGVIRIGTYLDDAVYDDEDLRFQIYEVEGQLIDTFPGFEFDFLCLPRSALS